MLRRTVAITRQVVVYPGSRLRFRLGMAGAVMGLMLGTLCAPAQEPGQQAVRNGGGRGEFAGMQRVAGEVTSISGATVTVKAEDGAIYEIVTTDNTRMMRGRGVPLKLADLKVGDGALAMGNLDAPNKTMHAAMLFATDGAQLREQRENLGKTFIAGKVTAIDLDNAKMTIERPDHVSQTIGFDESTSFRRGGRGGMGMNAGEGSAAAAPAPTDGASEPAESITLADIKVGDNVRGTGSMKGGVFVPTRLVVAAPGRGQGQGRGRRGAGEGSATPAAPATSAPQGPGAK
jgi:hypothetical protein